MSQAVGHLQEAAKDFTVPKMKAGVISSATKFPARNFSGGLKAVRPLASRKAVAFGLAASAPEPLYTNSRNPKNSGNRRFISPPHNCPL